jgi:5-methylcytosine-specific restriction endonuclease McrA
MSGFARPCRVCGARSLPGRDRCPAHEAGSGRASSCRRCGVRTAGAGLCPRCQAVDQAERAAAQSYREGYHDPVYQENRRRRFELARGLCEVCGLALDPDHFECHHVLALSEGGDSSLANLRVTHGSPCHRELSAAARRRRRKGRGPPP